jgi:hypothetical protein
MSLNGGDPRTYKSKITKIIFCYIKIILEICDDVNTKNHQHGLSSSTTNGMTSNTNSFTNQTNSSTSYNYSASNVTSKTDSLNRSSNDRRQ